MYIATFFMSFADNSLKFLYLIDFIYRKINFNGKLMVKRLNSWGEVILQATDCPVLYPFSKVFSRMQSCLCKVLLELKNVFKLEQKIFKSTSNQNELNWFFK
jgi:hypothetical protein